ncbi:MAG: tetratricopeptide repeat protein [Planctomycetes bacterium]|nr:tetratricopeptide repeat protein [Planctomycetota bacterium]
MDDHLPLAYVASIFKSMNKRMRIGLPAFLLVLATGLLAGSLRAEVAGIDLESPGPREFVRDLAEMIDEGDKTKIQEICDKLLTEKATPIIVVTIDSMAKHGGEDGGSPAGVAEESDVVLLCLPDSPDVERIVLGDEEEEESSLLNQNLVTRVLNLTGQDVIAAKYEDKLRPDGKAELLGARARLLSNGKLAVTDRDYEKEIERLHVGEKLFLMVTDADQDRSDERDMITVEVESEFGEKESLQLAETLSHSGVFTGSFLLTAVEKPQAGNLNADDPQLESYFGDTLRIRYLDTAASTESGQLLQLRELPVVIGTDGLVAAFTKTFNDETLAVETRFRIAESYFELFKSHKELGREEEKKTDLESGRRVLREVMEDYPDPKYVPRVAYLLGQYAQELEQWEEAIRSYELILRQFPDHTLAADAQYKLAQSYEESGEFDKALEEYVTLAATYPKSPLISSVMIRISDYFYKTKKFDVAAQVGQKFLERFEGNEHASRMAFRVGQCYYKAKEYTEAGQAFDRFEKKFPDDDLSADAFFWAGESYRLANNNFEAFRRYQNCRYEHPSSEAAKYARGRLALPEMLQQFEADVNSVDQP